MGEKQTLQINSFNKIDEYIKNIDYFSNPQNKESELFNIFIQSVNSIIEEYKTKWKIIKEKLKNLIILDNSININFDSSIFPNFNSTVHLWTH